MTAVRPSKIQRLCRRAPSLLLLGFLFAEVSSLLPAQRWSERFALSQRRRAGIGYDPSRDRLVLFGGTRSRATTFNAGNVQETYEWDGLTWTRRTGLTFIQPTPSDSTRAMVLDPFTRRVLLLNNNPTTVQMELYRFEGRLWQSVSTPTRPNYRQHYAGAFDEERRRLVAWGGSTQAGGAELDVWEYNGVEWFRIGAPGPAGRNDPALAWDGVRGKVIMFGGRTTDVAPTPLADMWEWNGAIWTRITPATLPPARSQHSMTWDPDRRKVVLFGGGIGVPGSTFNDTWEWDGTNWARATTAVSPPARAGHGAAYHLSRQRLVITCGEGGADLLADTWEFDGTAWVETTPPDSPAQRSDHGAAFDNARGNMVLFGGRDFSNQAL